MTQSTMATTMSSVAGLVRLSTVEIAWSPESGLTFLECAPGRIRLTDSRPVSLAVGNGCWLTFTGFLTRARSRTIRTL